jgi:hypothetical protein
MASEAWLRRFALQIGAQLPDDPKDARKVLDYVEELFNGFMMPRSGPEMRQDAVLRLNRPATLARSSNRSPGIPLASPSSNHMLVSPGTD